MERPNKRKREQDRREKLAQYGVDLPDIRGLPVQVVPLHVHALRQANKFFKVSTNLVHPQHQKKKTSDRLTRHQTSIYESSDVNVVQAILGRIDQQARAVEERQQDVDGDSRARLQMAMKQATEAWIDSIRRFHHDSRKCKTVEGSNVTKPVPLAAFEHLWNIVMNVEKSHAAASRRAALHLAAQLLSKISDCRQWLLELNDNLSEYVETMVHSLNTQPSAIRGSTSSLNQFGILQQEGYNILSHLMDQGYSEMYPTLTVALRRYEQLCPHILSGSLDDTHVSMQVLRQRRDRALELYMEEEGYVLKLIRKAYLCADVIFPRFVSDSISICPQLTLNSGEDDDVEGEIAWEDATDDDVVPHGTSDELHSLSVERTLQAMQAAVAMRNGGLEIDLSGNQSRPELDSGSADASILKARETLRRIAEILEQKYMPLFADWLEGLLQADSLTIARPGIDESHVAMPNTLRERRADAARRLLNLKQAIAKVLKVAQKLRVGCAHDAAAEPRTRSRQPPQGTDTNFVPRVSGKDARQRIQIKLKNR